MAELFIELFSEEIPAKLQIDARQKIKHLIEERLKKREIDFKSSRSFSTPKRLVFVLDKIPEKIVVKKKIIMSTGMANMKEIDDALKILISNGTKKKNITVMQCNTEYPTPIKDANLNAMLTIKKHLKVDVGYSDHTEGIEASLAAAAIGAKIIENHFTLNKNMIGPDHKASIEENELVNLVKGVRKISLALGDGVKKVSPSEKRNIKIARNSLVAAENIKKGKKFTIKNIIAKRPGTGISPMYLFKVIGKRAKKNFVRDELIKI